MEKLIRNNRLSKEELLVDETIFSVANGYLGTRGTFVEGYGKEFEYNQTYLNAFFNYYDYSYEEYFTGYPKTGQKFANLIDGQKMRFYIEGKLLNMENCEVISLNRIYDIEKGITKRRIHYKTKNGYEFILREEKFVSRKIEQLIVLNIEIESINYIGEMEVFSYISESKKLELEVNDPRINNTNETHLEIINISKENRSVISKTSRSDLFLETSISHNFDFKYSIEDNILIGKKVFELSHNSKICITKYIVYTSNLYQEDYHLVNLNIVNKLSTIPYDKLTKYQEEYYKKFWNISYIKIDGKNDFEQLLNYNIFQLNNSGAENKLHNISAKGLSGEGYEGHYFWDTEIYMIPFFILTNKEKAKNLLMYRYNIIEKARDEAHNMGYEKGVKFPWRTINGVETSPYYPAGSAQFHMNCDVAYAVIKYFEGTNDKEFIINYGFEMLVESARFLKEVLSFDGEFYHLNNVTGPDEYTTLVNDNYYTNSLLKYQFAKIAKYYNDSSIDLTQISKKLDITDIEIETYSDIAKKIYFIFDESLNIYAQDSSFLSKKILDLKCIPEEKFPLLLNYHPLFLSRHQVLKQADSLLSMMLLDFDDSQVLEDSFNYYEPLTTHDSSLSMCIYSILAFQLKKLDFAVDFFVKVLETDYLNTHENTKHGLHLANLGGSYLGFIYGIVGLRIHESYLKINPILVDQMTGYELNIMYQDAKVKIIVTNKVKITSSKPINIKIYNKVIYLNKSYETDLVL